MAEPPLLTLSDIALGFGGRPLFQGVTLAVQPGERLAVVGRNGAGKSTLLRIAAGLVEPDRGTRFVRPGATVAYLPQAPDFGGYASLGDYAAAGLAEDERWRADSAMDGLKVAAGTSPDDASGGERRRAALARLIAAGPDLLLLDEPTNHLDIEAIGWLEEFLDQGRAGFALISHDRRFLERLTRATLWLDRGEVRRSPEGFAGFEAWREQLWQEEDAARHKLNRLIAEEARWAVEGISARRRRNQGRVRRLAELRAERAAQVRRQGPAAMALESGAQSGKLVVEAEGASVALSDLPILRDVTLRIARGERVAIVGPNGAGKTTLLKLLTGALQPDCGRVRLGTNLLIEVFDQERAALDPDRSLWETLTGDAAAGAAGGDQVMVRGRPRHVVGYLKDFLFDERQARGPVRALSGGEKARLLLARIMARPANLLVLDEPTNDLDIETLDLLQELLAEFDGTVLMVSHDRDFIDRTATTTIALEGDGRAIAYAGGWSDYQAQKDGAPAEAPRNRPVSQPARPGRQERRDRTVQKLSFRQAHRLDTLPDEIARLEAEIAKLESFLSDPDVYAKAPEKAAKAGEALIERQSRLAAAEEEWLELEALRETLEG